ncbi:MAG: cupredoxin domain-containing protein [Candidatus Rokuibacteriota bacterium]
MIGTTRLSVQLAVCSLAATLGFGLAGDLRADERAGTTHIVFMTAFEVKGATTTDKLAPPAQDPLELSKGYSFKGSGPAGGTPLRWEVSSYMFNPASVTVRQGDEVDLTVFVVNGDEHEAWVTAPDGTYAVPKAMWNRGREYRVRFRVDKMGTYQLVCSSHAPSMAASFVVLPR